jgi:hypothetical protein
MNKSLDKKEEITLSSAKQRKSMEKGKRVTGYLKNMVNQKDSQFNKKTVCSSSPSSLCREGKQSSHLQVSQAAAMTEWLT